jgi:hypothetical protein
MNLLDYLKSLAKSENIRLEVRFDNATLRHTSTVIVDEIVVSGGTSSDINTSKKIAIAEAFERLLIKNINEKELFLLNKYPTTCGFAAGFDNESTKNRSLCEAIERWGWSNWIDHGYSLDNTTERWKNFLKSYNNLEFDNFSIYEKTFKIYFENEFIDLYFLVFLGFTNDGVFPGSRVRYSKDDLIDHAIDESIRNKKNFLLNKDYKTLASKRNLYFGKNKQVALIQIEKSKNENWPELKIKLLQDYSTNIPGVFLWRCLIDNFIGWDKGDETRFVY